MYPAAPVYLSSPGPVGGLVFGSVPFSGTDTYTPTLQAINEGWIEPFPSWSRCVSAVKRRPGGVQAMAYTMAANRHITPKPGQGWRVWRRGGRW